MLNLYALMIALEDFNPDYLKETKVKNLTLEDVLMILKEYHESLDFITVEKSYKTIEAFETVKTVKTVKEVENDNELFATVK